jgi:hypothetical protein
MSLKLNQIVALVKGKKARIQAALTEIHHGWKPDSIAGLARTYTPTDEDGQSFPNECKLVNVTVSAKLAEIKDQIEDFFNIIATQENGNTLARADIKVDGKVVCIKVPVSALMFLEKQLIDLRTMVSELPVLAVNKTWLWSEDRGCYVAPPEESIKTAKIPKVLTLAEATKEHPAQTQVYTEDVRIGTWKSIHMSGAIPVTTKQRYLTRITELRDAVKIAREEANSGEVTMEAELGSQVLAHIFDK